MCHTDLIHVEHGKSVKEGHRGKVSLHLIITTEYAFVIRFQWLALPRKSRLNCLLQTQQGSALAIQIAHGWAQSLYTRLFMALNVLSLKSLVVSQQASLELLKKQYNNGYGIPRIRKMSCNRIKLTTSWLPESISEKMVVKWILRPEDCASRWNGPSSTYVLTVKDVSTNKNKM